MPPKKPGPSTPARPIAPHVARAVQALQAKPAARPVGRQSAAHVAAAVGRGAGAVQPASRSKKKIVVVPPGPNPSQGVPPSQEKHFSRLEDERKYPHMSGYLRRRQEHQQDPERRVNVEQGVLEEMLLGVEGRGAGYMLGQAIIAGTVFPIAASDTHVKSLASPFPHDHGPEYEVSSGDVEVGFLSGALDLFGGDLASNAYGDEQRLHELALVDEFGACNGCKDRIKRFKQLWHELAAKYHCPAQLRVTYFYRQRQQMTRSGNKTLYGWEEASHGSFQISKKKVQYEYWSAKPKSYTP